MSSFLKFKFKLCLLPLLLTACGPSSTKPSSARIYQAGSEEDRAQPTRTYQPPSIADVDVAIPNAPFAMMGGGPRHHHRALIAGPSTTPVQVAQFSTGARVFASPIIGPDGTVYVGSTDGTFNALKLDGHMRWSYICEEPIFSTAAISHAGVVYVGCDDDTLLAFSSEGTELWQYRMQHDVDSSPVIADNGTIYVGGEGLHAIRANGRRLFKVWLGGHVSASPTVRGDGVIVVGSHDHRMYAVAPNGTVLWSFATGGSILSSAAAMDNNDIVFGSDDNCIYRLTPNGAMRWRFPTDDRVRAGLAVSENGASVYVASMDGLVFAIDAANGTEQWRFRTAGPVRKAPILDSEGHLYVSSRDHHLYAIDSSSGKLIWSIGLEDELDAQPAVAMGRRLVTGCDDGTIRVFGEETEN